MATYYIDPSSPFNGDGSLATPFNDWTSVTWGAGNSYLQKSGTIYKNQITVGASGTSSAYIYLGIYGGTTKALVSISTDATEGIRLSTRSYIIVENFLVSNSFFNPSGSSIGIHVRQACTNCIIRNCEATGFYYGFLGDNFNLLASSQTNILYDSCYAHDNWGNGFHCTNACNTITWKNCRSSRNGFTTKNTGGHGFSCIAERQNTFSWTLVSGTVYSAPITLTNPLLRITNVTDGPASLTLNAGAGPGATLTLNQYDISGSTVYVNIGKSPSTVTMQAFSNDLYNLSWINCISEFNIQGYPSEGHGWMVDEGTINSTLYRCISRYNEFDGFQAARGLNINFISCLSYGNAQDGFRANSAANGTTFSNCTSIQNKNDGFEVGTLPENISFINCGSFYNRKGYTLRTTSTSNYCCSYGNSVSDSGGTVTNLITSDPVLSRGFQPKATSSLIGAGTSTSNLDKNAATFWTTPSVGAFEYIRPRTFRS